MNRYFTIERQPEYTVLRLISTDGTNLLSRACVLELTAAIRDLAGEAWTLILTGNERFFSAGADLQEIRALTGAEAYEFGLMGQAMTGAVENFPAPVYAAIQGPCMGEGLDLALACHHRVASRGAMFGHRGAALGLMTGWGGTQRLPRLVGKARALQIFATAETMTAHQALAIGLIDGITKDPVAEAIRQIERLVDEDFV